MLFQSTRPVWGATGQVDGAPLSGVVSIHAPRVGRDRPHRAPQPRDPCFNPRAPCGARPQAQGRSPRRPVVSIHAPRVGRDEDGVADLVAFVVSIHAPRVGRDRHRADDDLRRHVSIHAPRVGRDMTAVSVPSPRSGFQSTRPVWGATFDTRRIAFAHESFNPRAPCGARPRNPKIFLMEHVKERDSRTLFVYEGGFHWSLPFLQQPASPLGFTQIANLLRGCCALHVRVGPLTPHLNQQRSFRVDGRFGSMVLDSPFPFVAQKVET
jgi:hypothetical protein